MDIQTLSKKVIGKNGLETNAVYRVTNKKGHKLTIADIKTLKEKFKTQALGKHDYYNLNCMKLYNGGGFKTATDENDLINYFDNLVKDPDKFLEYDFIDFNVNYST